MRFCYNVLFTTLFLLASPYYFFRLWRRGNWVEGFGQRFGRYGVKLKQAITNRQVIWIHAVSVGEVNLCTQLIRALESRLPNIKIVVSTTTTTGMGELLHHLPSHVSKVYYPIDRRPWVSRALASLHPEAVILVEAEIWPNFLWRAQKRGTPVFLVNARLSDRSHRGYMRLAFLFRPLFASLEGVGAQTEADAAKLRELGCRPEAIHVVGSLKYDAARLEEKRRLDVAELLKQVGVEDGAPVIVAGSTHQGEEDLLAEMLPRLKARFPGLFLVLVPRHFERGREVGRELESRGVKFVYRSEIVEQTQLKPGDVDCLLVNSTGELKHFYERATVIFVGKSLAAQGGQNPIEPGALAKPMVFGPNMQNFSEIVNRFLEEKGAVQVQSAAGLEQALTELLGNEQRRSELGANALKVVRQNQGAIDRTVEMIIAGLDHDELYIAPQK